MALESTVIASLCLRIRIDENSKYETDSILLETPSVKFFPCCSRVGWCHSFRWIQRRISISTSSLDFIGQRSLDNSTRDIVVIVLWLLRDCCI